MIFFLFFRRSCRRRGRTSGTVWLAVLLLAAEMQWAPWALAWTFRAGAVAVIAAPLLKRLFRHLFALTGGDGAINRM